jgi:RAD54-like protein 2
MSLPQKEEYVIMIRMSPIQQQLYRKFILQVRTSGLGAWGSSNNPIKAFAVCCKVGLMIMMF